MERLSLWERTINAPHSRGVAAAPPGFERLEAWRSAGEAWRNDWLLRLSSELESGPATPGHRGHEPAPRMHLYSGGGVASEARAMKPARGDRAVTVVRTQREAAAQAGDVFLFDGAEVVLYRDGRQRWQVLFPVPRSRRGALTFALLAPFSAALDLAILPINVWIWIGLSMHHH